MLSLICKACKTSHKATNENFPIVLHGDIEMFEGKGKNRKSVGPKRVVVGYICKKCLGKHRQQEFIKEFKIHQSPGQKIRDAIKDKVQEMKIKAQNKPRPIVKPVKPKSWIKRIFTNSKGRD